MNKTTTPEGEVTLEIEVAVEEAGDQFSEALRSFQREAKVPGFRPGKAPLDMIRQRWGRTILSDRAEEIARRYLVKALEAEKLEPGGKIEISLLEYGEDKPLRFKAVFPLQAEAKLTVYRGLRVTVNDALVTDADVDRQLEALRHRHAVLRAIDTPAPADARLTLKVQEVDPSGLPLVGRPVEEVGMEFGLDRLGVGSDERLFGIRAGERRLISVRPGTGELSRAPYQSRIVSPGQQQENARRDDVLCLMVEALRVEVPELPELNDDFARQVSEKLKTLDSLREYTRLNLMGYVAAASQRVLERAVISRLIEENPFPVPRGIIESMLEEAADDLKLQGDKRRQFIQEHYAEAEREYRWLKLRDEIVRKEAIEVSDEELNTEVERMAEQRGEPAAKIHRSLERDDGWERLRRNMLDRRTMEFLSQNAAVEKREMELQEFIRATETAD